MKKVRVIAGITAMVPAAAAGLKAPTATYAATNKPTDHGTPQAGKTVKLDHRVLLDTTKWARIINSKSGAFLYSNGGLTWELWDHSSVHVTCYYTGKSTHHASDPYWDHVDRVRNPTSSQSIRGHIADYFVNFGGKYPANQDY